MTFKKIYPNKHSNHKSMSFYFIYNVYSPSKPIDDGIFLLKDGNKILRRMRSKFDEEA